MMSTPPDGLRRPVRQRPSKIVAEDAWAWIDHDEADPPIDIRHLRVTAVLVSHNAAAWLGQTLQSLRGLTVRPHRFVAVDTGSADESLALLQQSQMFDLGLRGSPEAGFGQAVLTGLHGLEDTSPGGAVPGEEWLWLLHDDITVHPDALRRLLECTVLHPDADVIGPKLLQPGRGDDPRRISELGVSISDTGRRECALEPGEIDQRQHRSAESLGVSSCGMLVRRRVFDALGGLAPELPVFRDGVEFGWRATSAGYRVRTCPEAVLVHRQAGRTGLRSSRLIGSDPGGTDRLLGMRAVAAHRGPLVSLRLLWGALLRAFGFLLAKAPDRSRSELRALGAFLDPGPVRALRRRVAPPASPEAAARVKALRPPWWSSLRFAADSVAAAMADRWQRSLAHDSDTSLDELTGDEFAAATDRPQRSALANPLVLTLLVLGLTTGVAVRELIRPGSLSSAVLLPAHSRLTDAYAAYLSPIVGAPGLAPPPWLGWTALGATLTFGRPEWFGTLLICGGVPLCFLTAILLLRRVVADRRVRLAAAVLYALIPVWLGATNRGLLEVALVGVLLPMLGVALRAVAVRRTFGPDSWRSAWAAGGLISIILAFAPVLSLLVAVAVVVGVVLLRRDRTRLGRLLVAAGVPVVLLAPWSPSLLRGWSRLLLGPDAGLRGLAAGESWQLMLGRTPGVGLPPLWLGAAVFGVIWLLGLIGALVRPRSKVVRGAWATALGSFALAGLLDGALASALPQGTRVRPDVTVLLLVGFAAVLLAGAAGLGQVGEVLSARGLGFAHIATALVSLLSAAALVGGLGWFAVAGATGPIKRTEMDELPPFIRNAMLSDARTRALVIEFDGEVPSWNLVADDQHRLGDADRGLAFGGSGSMPGRMQGIVTRLIGGAGDERVADDLAGLAVSHVWVRGATGEQRSRITNTPGLGAEAAIGDTVVWTVPGAVGRYVVVGAGEPIVVPATGVASAAIDLPPGASRRLIIREPADPRWRVTLNGQRLAVQAGTDSSIVELPAQPGRLEIGLAAPLHRWLALGQLLLVLVVAILAGPSLAGSRQRRAELGARAAGARGLPAEPGRRPRRGPPAPSVGRRAAAPGEETMATRVLSRLEEDR